MGADPAEQPPRRIVSFSPGLTEIVIALGVPGELVGISDRCPAVEGARRVGSLLDPDYAALTALKPDIVLTVHQPELEAELAFQQIECMPISLDSFQLLMDAIRALGTRLGADERAQELEGATAARIVELRNKMRDLPSRRVLFVFGDSPRWVAGYQSIFHDMIHFSHGVNAATAKGAKCYPLSIEDLDRASPQAIVIALDLAGKDEGARARTIADERRYWRRHNGLPAVRSNQLCFVDERDFLDVGLRSLDGWVRMARALHPDQLAERFAKR